jgi:hypothetical protein
MADELAERVLPLWSVCDLTLPAMHFPSVFVQLLISGAS